MACFSLGFVEQILIWLVIIGAVVGLLRLLLPFIMSQLGVEASAGAAVVIQAVRIVLWAIVAIAIIIIIFDLIACLLGSGPYLRR